MNDNKLTRHKSVKFKSLKHENSLEKIPIWRYSQVEAMAAKIGAFDKRQSV